MNKLMMEYSERYPSLLISLEGVNGRIPPEMHYYLEKLDHTAMQYGHMLKIHSITDDGEHWSFQYDIYVLHGGDPSWDDYESVLEHQVWTPPK